MKQAVFWLVLFFALGFLVTFENQFVLAPAAWLAIALVDRRAFRVFQDWRFLVFLSFLLLGVPLVCGEKEASFLGVSYSRSVFQESVVMAHRSVILLLGLRLFTGRISTRELSGFLGQGGFRSLGLALSLAVDSLPQIRGIVLETYREYRQTQGGGSVFSKAFGFLVRLFVRVLFYAQTLRPAGDDHPPGAVNR